MRAPKCKICGKPIKECDTGQDPNKVCQGHTYWERKAYEEKKQRG